MTNWQTLKQGVKFTLPDCGLEVRLRPVDFTIQAAYGGFSDEMMSVILKSVREMEGQIVLENLDLGATVGQMLLQSRTLMEGYARCAFVTPRIVDDPQDEDEISAQWLSMKDLQFVYGMQNMSLPELIRFSEEQAESLLALSDQPVDTSKT